MIILSPTVPSPTLSVEVSGTQYVGSRLEVSCFLELPDPGLGPYVTIDYFDGVFNNLSSLLEENPQERIQLLPTQQHNATHFVRTIIVDRLEFADQDTYYCVGNFSGPYVLSSAAIQERFVQVFRKFRHNSYSC